MLEAVTRRYAKLIHAKAAMCLIAAAVISEIVSANPDPAPRKITTPLFSVELAATALLATGIAPSTVAVERQVVSITPATVAALLKDRSAEFTVDLPGMGLITIDIHRHIQHSGGEVGLIGSVRGAERSRVILEIGEGLLIGDIIRGLDMVQIRLKARSACSANPPQDSIWCNRSASKPAHAAATRFTMSSSPRPIAQRPRQHGAAMAMIDMITMVTMTPEPAVHSSIS